MPHQPENLTAEQSLDIIAAMIREAKRNVRSNYFFFLFWGWVIAIANLGVFVLQKLEVEQPYLIWAITIPRGSIQSFVCLPG